MLKASRCWALRPVLGHRVSFSGRGMPLVRGVYKLDPSVVVDRGQTVGEHPRVPILRRDGLLARQHVDVAPAVAHAVAHQRVVAQGFRYPMDALHRLPPVARLHIAVDLVGPAVIGGVAREILRVVVGRPSVSITPTHISPLFGNGAAPRKNKVSPRMAPASQLRCHAERCDGL